MYNLKKVKNTYVGLLLLVKLQTKVDNFLKSNTPPWVFFTFLKLTNGTKSRMHLIMNPKLESIFDVQSGGRYGRCEIYPPVVISKVSQR